MTRTTPPPNVPAVLDGLKDFQRQTVEHVHRRFFLDSDRTSRFLVADEVGLGKTLVAKGVTALALDALWDETERIDVVYICSNAEIARQNLNRLKVIKGADYARPTRLTLLPRAIRDIRNNKLNFVSLTPGTSFDPHSAMGVAEERAVLYLMLREEWDLGRRKTPLSIFCGGMERGRFKENWVDRLQWHDDIDPKLMEHFLRDLRAAEKARRASGDRTLREWFDELTTGPFARKQWDAVSDDAGRQRRELIGLLRSQLAQSCIDALEPDLVILDEFQRFKPLLDPETEAGELATQLFRFEDSRTGQPARTLLLSATPYTAYSTAGDPEEADHYDDFIQTVKFLLDDEAAAKRLRDGFEELRLSLLRWGDVDVQGIERIRSAIEKSLSRVIARTERLASSADRSGMLRQRKPVQTRLEAEDIGGYLALQRISEALDQYDTIEYWKSSPYLLNLMDGYALKRDLLEALKGHGNRQVERAITSPHANVLDWEAIQDFQPLDPSNARMRELSAQMIESGAWRLLWLPPALPYYRLAGNYADPEVQGLTKRLVFSSWTVVPKAIALALSYEAERRMTLAGDSTAKNDPVSRGDRSGRLRFSVSKGRLTGMPVLGLLYPSFALAEATDPKDLAAAAEGKTPTTKQALGIASKVVREQLRGLDAYKPRTRGRVDERWYWAAPILLDAAIDPAATRGWLGSPALSELSQSEEASAENRWQDHLVEAERLLTENPGLGRPPADLPDVLARLALAGPGVCSLRSLARGAAGPVPAREPAARDAAINVAWAFRSLFNLPEVFELLRASGAEGQPLWRHALDYCLDGCLQSVLDEYAHVLAEYLGHVDRERSSEVVDEIANAMAEAIGIRTTRASIDIFEPNERGRIRPRRERMRARFALRFGDQQGEDDKVLARTDQVRTAFNSPFWPFVLATTSVGQEGLDFHLYCHAVVHWNLPSNPVDLEQREGRVHRYKGHAIRKNLVLEHGRDVLSEAPSDPWASLFSRGESDRPRGESELWPYWVYTGNGSSDRSPEQSGDVAMIERHVPALPLSRDRERLGQVSRALAMYRSVMGQSRQEDLIRCLTDRVPEDDWERCADSLKIDLSPPRRPRLKVVARPEAMVSSEVPGEDGRADVGHGVEEGSSEYANMALEAVGDAYTTGSDLFRELLEELARHPDQPRPFAVVEGSLSWKRGRIASILGGYSNKAKARYGSKWPLHVGQDPGGGWWIWMDGARAEIVRRAL